MGRVGLIMAALAFVTVGLSMLIPLLGALLVAPAAAALIGAGAGWWASKVMGYGTAGRGVGAGALAGLGALLGSTIVLTVVLSMFGNSSQFQQQFQQALQNAARENPGTTLPNINVGAVATIGGGVAGFCLGLVYLFLAMIGGLIAGVIYGRNRGPAPSPAAPGGMGYGSYPAPGSEIPRMTSGAGEHEGGARIYGEDDERR